MSFKVIVGINGAAGGVDALALARRLAPPAAEIVGVVIAVLEDHPTRAVNLDYDARVREDARLHAAGFRAENRDVQGEVHESASVAEGLHAVADRLDADLPVVGSCRHGFAGRVFSGDDVLRTLRGAPCPVAVAPRDFALLGGPIATIGLGWNARPEAEHALGFARALAGGLGAQLHALTVVTVPAWPEVEGTTTGPENDAAVERAADALAGLDGIQTSTAIGASADELAIFAAEVDALVVGSHQRGPLGRIAMGSTSETLARRCARPLVVVPRVAAHAVSPA